MHWKRFAGSALLTVLSAAFGQAGTITPYTDRSTFNSAVGPTTTETFGPHDCFPLPGPVSSSSSLSCNSSGGTLAPGTLQAGATYSATLMSSNSNLFNIDGAGGFPTSFLDALGSNSNSLIVTFAGPVSAVGFDTNTLMGNSFTITFNFVGGGSTQLVENISSVLAPNLDFFGFQSSAQDIASISVLGSNGNAAFDNFSFTATGASGVPEPSEIIPLTAALGMIYALRRRSSR